MEKLSDFFSKKYVYAIVGASNNEKKYGYKIYEILKKSGVKVFPINPKEETIQGDKCYYSLSQVPEKIDIVDFVVPPNITLKVLEEVVDLGIKKVWFQPGSFDYKCEKFCKQNGISYLKEFCLYAEALKKLK